MPRHGGASHLHPQRNTARRGASLLHCGAGPAWHLAGPKHSPHLLPRRPLLRCSSTTNGAVPGKLAGCLAYLVPAGRVACCCQVRRVASGCQRSHCKLGRALKVCLSCILPWYAPPVHDVTPACMHLCVSAQGTILQSSCGQHFSEVEHQVRGTTVRGKPCGPSVGLGSSRPNQGPSTSPGVLPGVPYKKCLASSLPHDVAGPSASGAVRHGLPPKVGASDVAWPGKRHTAVVTSLCYEGTTVAALQLQATAQPCTSMQPSSVRIVTGVCSIPAPCHRQFLPPHRHTFVAVVKGAHRVRKADPAHMGM